jgi:hypothetical protein
MDKGRKTWRMTFDELPAYETWTIECELNHNARNLCLLMDETKPREEERRLIKDEDNPTKVLQPAAPRLSHAQLILPADQSSVFVGRRMTPELWWATLAVIIALGAYSSAFYIFVYREYRHLGNEDWVAPVSISVFGFGLWLLTRRPAPSISQGYWTPNPASEQLKTGGEVGEIV